MISICREHAGNVKRWQDGTMALRWCAAGMVEAGKQFRRVNGYLHLPALRAALEAEVGSNRHRHMRGSGGGGSGLMVIGAATEVPRNSGHPRPIQRLKAVQAGPALPYRHATGDRPHLLDTKRRR